VDFPLVPAKADKQFKRAQELKPRHTAKIERMEAGELVVKVKHLDTREEKVFNREQGFEYLKSQALVSGSNAV
jgi:histidyl-tRNA synthetase